MDFMFTTIFNKEENISILENFLSCYLEISLNEIKGNLKLLKRKLAVDNKKESSKEVDLLLNYNGKTINIELSNERKSTGIIERNIVFACKLHSKDLRYGEKSYNTIEDTIQINLNNFRCNKHDIKEEYYLVNKYGKVLSKKLRIDMVDLVLGKNVCYNLDNNKLSRWCRVFLAKNRNELNEVLGSDLMEQAASKKLVEEIDTMSSDDEYVELYTKLSRREMEYNTYIEEAKEEGKLEEKKKIAKSMISEKIDIALISKITGLSIDELKQV